MLVEEAFLSLFKNGIKLFCVAGDGGRKEKHHFTCFNSSNLMYCTWL